MPTEERTGLAGSLESRAARAMGSAARRLGVDPQMLAARCRDSELADIIGLLRRVGVLP